MLLAMMGFGSCAGDQITKLADQAATANDAAKRKQAIAAAWRDLDAAWEYGGDYAFGRHGIWPFDKAGKDAVLKKTEQFDSCVATLERFGEIRSIEADALKLEWDFIQEQIELLPAADLRKGLPRQNAERQVNIRKGGELLAHLTALTKADSVNQPVVRIVHHRVSKLIWRLKYSSGVTSYPLARQARTEADKLFASRLKLESRTATGGTKLEKDPSWEFLADTIREEWLDGWNIDVKDDRIVPCQDPGEYSNPGHIRRKHRLLDWARVRLGKMVDQGLLSPAERDALRWMLPVLPAANEMKGFGEGFFPRQWDENNPMADRWAGLFAQLAGGKSMPAPLHPILMSAMETRINLAAERDLGLCLVHPDHYRWENGYYSPANRKKMRQALAAVRKMPLTDGSKLLETDDWKKISGACRVASALAECPWLISYHDRRRIGELFEPLDRGISSLVDKGLLAKPQADILQDRRVFMLQVAQDYDSGYNKSGIQAAACNRLSRRAALLDKLAAMDRLDWRVADYILPAVEGDMSLLGDLEEDFKWGKGPNEFDFGLEESPFEKELKTWTDNKGGVYKADDLDYRGRHKSVIDKMIVLRDEAGSVLRKIRDKQIVGEKSLLRTNEWRVLSETWRDAQALTIWWADKYLFNRFGAARLVGRLADSIWDVERLRRSGLLSDAEAGLLSSDLKLFIQAAEHQTPWEEPESTAHTPSFPLYKDRWPVFGKRVSLLEELADSPELRPEIVGKIIYSLEADIESHSMWPHVRKTSPAEKKQIDEAKESARKLIDKMRKRLAGSGSSLLDSAEWRRMAETFSIAAEAANAGTAFRKRKEIQLKLNQAFADTYLLYAQGVLTGKEASIVTGQIAFAHQWLIHSPPSDFANGLYMNAMSRFVYGHPCDDAICRAYGYELEDVLAGTTPRREILKVTALSLEADIRILENRPLPYCCDEHEPEDFVEQTKKLKAVLAKVRKEISAGQ